MKTAEAVSPDLRRQIREAFPALRSGTVFLENAGGSQVPKVVADAVYTHMVDRYVQLGAGYERSRLATETVAAAHRFAAVVFGARVEDAARSRPEEDAVVLGPSTTGLLRNLAEAYADVLRPGQEIVIAESNHEANIGPWLRLQGRGVSVRWWRLSSEVRLDPEDLGDLLNENTALVIVPHVSNLLGEILDLTRVTRMAHSVGARVVADGVAYAPHRVLEVAEWGVDWYVYSTYKVYGPHLAALYGRADAARDLTGPNHFFISREEMPYKFEPGGVSHEGCAGVLALGEYLRFLATCWDSADGMDPSGSDAAIARGSAESTPADRVTVRRAFEAMEQCEREPQRMLIEYLENHAQWRLIGPGADRPRVATISFRHAAQSSLEITRGFDEADIAIRHGHMYAYRLCQSIGVDPADGVIRISLVHYNTPEEIDRVIDLLGSLDRA